MIASGAVQGADGQQTTPGSSSSHAITLVHPPQYTPCYCEENAYLLCQQLAQNRQDDVHVVLISNPAQQVAFWHQRASNRADGLVVWDYHVLVVQATSNGALVWDLDTCVLVLSPPVCDAFKCNAPHT